MNFKEWIQKEMAGTGAIVGCKDRGNPNFQIWGAMSDLNCKRKSKTKISKKIIEHIIEKTQAESFRINDVNPEWVFNVFEKSYKKSTGLSWSLQIFISRANNWVFYGIPPSYENDPAAGFVAVRFQRSGLVKLTGVAGNFRAILKGLDLIEELDKPVWGSVSRDIAEMAKRKGFIVPHPEIMKTMAKLIPGLDVSDSGEVKANIVGIGSLEKIVIVNQNYIDWFKQQYPQHAQEIF